VIDRTPVTVAVENISVGVNRTCDFAGVMCDACVWRNLRRPTDCCSVLVCSAPGCWSAVIVIEKNGGDCFIYERLIHCHYVSAAKSTRAQIKCRFPLRIPSVNRSSKLPAHLYKRKHSLIESVKNI
jgi:hypothetical protein